MESDIIKISHLNKSFGDDKLYMINMFWRMEVDILNGCK